MSKPEYEKIGSRVIHLIEECSELIQILCKTERFGWNSYHPDDLNKKPNYEKVLYEIEDVEKRIRELRNLILDRIFSDKL